MVYNHGSALTGPIKPVHALVAQLDRVLASEAKGRGFDSRRARHLSKQPAHAGFFIAPLDVEPPGGYAFWRMQLYKIDVRPIFSNVRK